MSNFYGMLLARHHLFPELKSKGLFGSKPLVAFTSEESHYSIVKGANLIGLGVENVVKVKTDKGECDGSKDSEILSSISRRKNDSRGA